MNNKAIKSDVNLSTLIEKFFYILGFVCTFNLITIKIGGIDLALANFVIIALICMMSVKNRFKITLNRQSIYIYILMILFVVSTMINIDYLNDFYLSRSIKMVFKIIILFLLLFLMKRDEFSELCKWRFFDGLKISIFCQMILGFCQLILYQFFHIDLNFLLLETENEMLNIYQNEFRIAGFTGNHAFFGLLMVIGFFLEKKSWRKWMYILVLLVSTSRTSIVAFAISILIIVIYRYLHREARYNRNLKIKKETLILILVGIFFLLTIVMVEFNVVVKFFEGLTVTIEKFQKGILGNDSSANMHIRFYTEIPSMWEKLSIIQILFGTGTYATGYTFSNITGIYEWLNFWNPDTDIVTIIIGNGIVTFVIYCIVYCKSIMNAIKNNEGKYASILLVGFIAGFGYLYIASTWTFLILLMTSLRKGEKNEK